ncbi:unnamed protein product [Lampetra fluviatilis]
MPCRPGTVLPAGTIFHPAEFRSSGPKGRVSDVSDEPGQTTTEIVPQQISAHPPTGSQHLTPVEPPVEPSKESEAAGTRFLFFCFFFPGGAAPIRPFSSRSQSPWGPSNEDPFQTVRFK